VARCPYAGNAAARCRGLVNTAVIDVLIHFGRAIRQGRKVNLSRKKTDDRDQGVYGVSSIQRTASSWLQSWGKPKWRVAQRVNNASDREFQKAFRDCI
jgi:hypothetical protein